MKYISSLTLSLILVVSCNLQALAPANQVPQVGSLLGAWPSLGQQGEVEREANVQSTQDMVPSPGQESQNEVTQRFLGRQHNKVIGVASVVLVVAIVVGAVTLLAIIAGLAIAFKVESQYNFFVEVTYPDNSLEELVFSSKESSPTFNVELSESGSYILKSSILERNRLLTSYHFYQVSGFFDFLIKSKSSDLELTAVVTPDGYYALEGSDSFTVMQGEESEIAQVRSDGQYQWESSYRTQTIEVPNDMGDLITLSKGRVIPNNLERTSKLILEGKALNSDNSEPFFILENNNWVEVKKVYETPYNINQARLDSPYPIPKDLHALLWRKGELVEAFTILDDKRVFGIDSEDPFSMLVAIGSPPEEREWLGAAEVSTGLYRLGFGFHQLELAVEGEDNFRRTILSLGAGDLNLAVRNGNIVIESEEKFWASFLENDHFRSVSYQDGTYWYDTGCPENQVDLDQSILENYTILQPYPRPLILHPVPSASLIYEDETIAVRGPGLGGHSVPSLTEISVTENQIDLSVTKEFDPDEVSLGLLSVAIGSFIIATVVGFGLGITKIIVAVRKKRKLVIKVEEMEDGAESWEEMSETGTSSDGEESDSESNSGSRGEDTREPKETTVFFLGRVAAISLGGYKVTESGEYEKGEVEEPGSGPVNDMQEALQVIAEQWLQKLEGEYNIDISQYEVKVGTKKDIRNKHGHPVLAENTGNLPRAQQKGTLQINVSSYLVFLRTQRMSPDQVEIIYNLIILNELQQALFSVGQQLQIVPGGCNDLEIEYTSLVGAVFYLMTNQSTSIEQIEQALENLIAIGGKHQLHEKESKLIRSIQHHRELLAQRRATSMVLSGIRDELKRQDSAGLEEAISGTKVLLTEV